MNIQLYFNFAKSGVLVLMVFFGIDQNLSAQSVYFVNSSSSPCGDGQSWSTSFNNLQDALDSACLHTPSEIWVAAGIYYPTQNPGDTTIGPLDRLNSFSLCSKVALYGGFIGNETQLEERDWIVNPTILSGDLDRNDSLTYNTYHVITCIGVDSTSLLDGFTITAGNANESNGLSDSNENGGGMYIENSTPVIRNCIFSGNQAVEGGGMYNSMSVTKLINCTFDSNMTAGSFGWGGGLANIKSSVDLSHCKFFENASKNSGGAIYSISASSIALNECNFNANTSGRGGAIYCNYISPASIMKCLFVGNTAKSDGGALYANDHSHTTLSHCLFVGNKASSGGGISNTISSQCLINDCVFDSNHGNSGGGITNSGALINIVNTTFKDNFADNDGGAISNLRSIYSLTDCILKGNMGMNGGALDNYTSSGKNINCTFSGNSAIEDGGAINNNSSFSLITNCLIWNNQASEEIMSTSASIFNNSFSGALIANSIVANSGGSSKWNGAIGTDDGFNIDEDPDFVDDVDLSNTQDSTSDLHLLVSSNAINAGTLDTTSLTLPSSDPDGNFRIAHGRIDIGAYEFQNQSTSPECSISGPDHVTSFTTNNYSGPDGMAAYTWTISGHGEIITPVDLRNISVKAGSVSSCLLILSAIGMDSSVSTCALKIEIEPDCNFYDTVQVLFVKSNATGGNNGLSWDNAFTELRDALALTCSGPKEIWVAEGAYSPTAFSSERDASFHLKNGIKIIGGFAGDETSSEGVDWMQHPVILSGDIDGNTSTLDNSFNVVNGSNTDSTASLQGFIIMDGFANAELDEYFPQSSGGGMYNVNCNANISSCLFTNNQVFSKGGGMCNINSAPHLRNCIFENNTSIYGSGGGIFNGDHSVPVMVYCTVSNNVSFFTGGGMSNLNSAPVMYNCVLNENAVTLGSGNGGGMYNVDSSPFLADCSFSKNKVNINRGIGGGMYNRMNSSPSIFSTVFSENAGHQGAGMYNESSSSPYMIDCSFNGNHTDISGKGGGMFNNKATAPILISCTFTLNSGRTSGGGMYNIDASPLLDECIFSRNIATENEGGGGMTNDHSNPVLQNCLFDADTSYLYGGGMYNINGSSLDMINCRFTNNLAGAGAGFYSEDDSLSNIQSCSFSQNTGLAFGGGVDIVGTMTLVNCTFTNNKAEGTGGAIKHDGNSGTRLKLINCSILGNYAEEFGGGVYNSSPFISLLNCTLSGNDAALEGGAFYNDMYSGGALTNCILWNNRAGIATSSTSASVFNDSMAIVEIDYSLIANSGGSEDWKMNAVRDLGNNIDVDPVFVEDVDLDMLPDSTGDLRLLISSPAINAGTPDTLGLAVGPLDLDGNERIHQLRIDMGAYEFQGIVAIPYIEHNNQDIYLFPNPANHSIHVISLEDRGDLTIMDMNGRVVLNKHDVILNPDLGYTVDVSNLLPGLYLMHFEGKEKSRKDQKFMILHDH